MKSGAAALALHTGESRAGMSLPDPVAVFQLQQQLLREYEEGVQPQAAVLQHACRNGDVLQALQVMGCNHSRMLIDRIVSAVEEGPERFLAAQAQDKVPAMRVALGAEDAKIHELAADIHSSMCNPAPPCVTSHLQLRLLAAHKALTLQP